MASSDSNLQEEKSLSVKFTCPFCLPEAKSRSPGRREGGHLPWSPDPAPQCPEQTGHLHSGQACAATLPQSPAELPTRPGQVSNDVQGLSWGPCCAGSLTFSWSSYVFTRTSVAFLLNSVSPHLRRK